MSTFFETKPKDEVMDIVGFLAYETVATLTEAALKVKKEWDLIEQDHFRESKVDQRYLFQKPNTNRSALRVHHIMEAYRRLCVKEYAMHNFTSEFNTQKILLF